MVIGNESKHLEQNQWYFTNTILPHTAFNGSTDERLHLVATILDKK
jgi:dihydroxyacid dehydratase/phosphogluconate dehydratase